MTEEVTEPVCETCRGEGKILHFYDRPGGPPGNTYVGCPKCEAGRRYNLLLEAELKPDDILIQLDLWISEMWRERCRYEYPLIMQRARNEIAKLREERLGEWGTTLIAKARAEALEEAAQVCEHRVPPVQEIHWQAGARACAVAIRALKDKPLD